MRGSVLPHWPLSWARAAEISAMLNRAASQPLRLTTTTFRSSDRSSMALPRTLIGPARYRARVSKHPAAQFKKLRPAAAFLLDKLTIGREHDAHPLIRRERDTLSHRWRPIVGR